MSSDIVDTFFTHLEWNDATERLLVEWSEIASCYVWIYDKGYRKYSSLNYKYSIPIIVLSTVTGTLSMSLNTILPSDYITTGQVALGSVNIFTGIITTLQNFFKYAQHSESHLNASTEWAKFERNLKIELSIERHNRKSAPDFIRIARHDYEKLLNNNPIIPMDIIEDFRKTVSDLKIAKPILIKSLETTKVYSDTNDNEINESPSKVSYFKRLASLIPGTKSFRQANGESPLGKLEIITTSDSSSKSSRLSSPKNIQNINEENRTPNRFGNDYLLSDTDASLRKIAADTVKNRSPAKETSPLSLNKIRLNLQKNSREENTPQKDNSSVENNSSVEEKSDDKSVFIVNTPQDPYNEAEDIIIQPVIHLS